MMLDRETLLVFGAFIPSLLGLVAMGVGGSLHERDKPLWLWGVAMLVAGVNQTLLLAMPSSTFSVAVANACFLAWIVVAVIAVGRSSGKTPSIPLFVTWAFAAWLAFVVCLSVGELRLGRLLNWPNIVAMLLMALYWAARDRRKRMWLARLLLLGGLALEAAAVAFRTTLVALGDQRALLMMQNDTQANIVFLSAATLGLILATLGMLLTAMDGVNRRLRFALDVDALTRLASRHAFFEATRRIPATERRALLMVDADHFKQINDGYGHAGGDAALRQMGAVFLATLPPGGLAARLGGEEFAVLLPPGSTDAALQHAEALRAAVSAQPATAENGGRIDMTVSIGVAIGEGGIHALLRHADAALYRAKAAGRDRCAVVDPSSLP
jgi:diguanylate cyclase (GGDEF)-like protein